VAKSREWRAKIREGGRGVWCAQDEKKQRGEGIFEDRSCSVSGFRSRGAAIKEGEEGFAGVRHKSAVKDWFKRKKKIWGGTSKEIEHNCVLPTKGFWRGAGIKHKPPHQSEKGKMVTLDGPASRGNNEEARLTIGRKVPKEKNLGGGMANKRAQRNRREENERGVAKGIKED